MTKKEACHAIMGDKLAHDMEYIADRSAGLYFAVLATTVAKVAGRGPAAPG